MLTPTEFRSHLHMHAPRNLPPWWAPAVLTAIVAAGVLICVYLPREEGRNGAFGHARLLAWLLTMLLFTAFGLVVSKAASSTWFGLIIDSLGRMSLANAQLFVWTVVVLSALFAGGLSNIGLKATNPLSITVPDPILLAMGISAGSLVAVPMALAGGKMRGRKVAAPRDPARANWRDLFTSEGEDLGDKIDLSKLQLFFITFALVLAYAAAIGYQFDVRGVTITSLPNVEGSFVVLLGVSQVAYLTNKLVPPKRNSAEDGTGEEGEP